MRVTSSMYYNNLYGTNNSKLSQELFDVNKQIASGLKIQYAYEDVTSFTQTMQLDNEVTVLEQIKKSTESGYKVSNQSDVALNEFTDNMKRVRTLLVQAANNTNDEISLDAIAKELRGLEEGFKNLANTSINGQYLFSGSAVDVKPISDDGTYNGNDVVMSAFLGSGIQQQYNVTGASLFLGEEKLVAREITSNVVNTNLLGTVALSADSEIRDLMGDIDNDPATINTDYFYLRGTKSDGTAFNTKVALADNFKISDLLTEVGKAFGNTSSVDIVNVSMNDSGEIIVQDKQKGSSKLDFHLVGAVDYSGGTAADVANIDSLDVAGANTYPPAGNLYVKEFMKSGLTSASGAATNIEGLIYDRTEFVKNGSTLSSSTPQILRKTNIVDQNGMSVDTITPERENSFAEPSTPLSEVFDLSQGTAGTLDGTQLRLVGKDISNANYDVTINLNSAGSTFTSGATTYTIYNMENPRVAVDADKMTYQQLMDVVNMAVTGSIPATTFADASAYDSTIEDSRLKGGTHLTYDGKMEFQSNAAGITPATMSLYDANSGLFGGDSSVATFNTNNALTVRDPKTDFFKTLDKIITAVENYTNSPDSATGEIRSVGIQNAISMMDDLQDHVFKMQSVAGANSNTLDDALQRTEILKISTKTLRSSVIDTDIAEANLLLSQLTLNYQAMLSTVSKVSKLSLVNYL